MIEKMLVKTKGTLHIVMDQFSFEMQFLIDDFQSGIITIEQLKDGYEQFGETFNLSNYTELLLFIRNNRQKIKLHSGNIPKPYSLRAC